MVRLRNGSNNDTNYPQAPTWLFCTKGFTNRFFAFVCTWICTQSSQKAQFPRRQAQLPLSNRFLQAWKLPLYRLTCGRQYREWNLGIILSLRQGWRCCPESLEKDEIIGWTRSDPWQTIDGEMPCQSDCRYNKLFSHFRNCGKIKSVVWAEKSA